jgi:hypothetical protein
MLFYVSKIERKIIVELTETVELMNSEDFKDRFRAEYYQLVNRRKGLKKMLICYADNTLKFTPKCSYDLLHSQLVFMDGYMAILEKRAEIEGISLSA